MKPSIVDIKAAINELAQGEEYPDLLAEVDLAGNTITKLQCQVNLLRARLTAVLALSDRKHDVWDEAKAALDATTSEEV